MKRITALNLRNAQLVVTGAASPRMLCPDGTEKTFQGPPVNGDWRKLLNRLIDGDLQGDSEGIACWLKDSGYVTEDGLPFTESAVTVAVRSWFFERAVAATFGMEELDPLHATSQLNRFRQYQDSAREKLARGEPPPSTKKLFRQLRAPSLYGEVVSDMSVWDAFFEGRLLAWFRVDSQGRPIVEVRPASPMQAIAMTILMDRVFTDRETGVCKLCHTTFIKRTRNQMFCPWPGSGTSHQSLWKTKFTRAKIRFLKEASEETPGNWSRIVRIAQQRLRKDYSKEKDKKLLTIPVEWAKKQLERK
jgi:hypothetical protein